MSEKDRELLAGIVSAFESLPDEGKRNALTYVNAYADGYAAAKDETEQPKKED